MCVCGWGAAGARALNTACGDVAEAAYALTHTGDVRGEGTLAVQRKEKDVFKDGV